MTRDGSSKAVKVATGATAVTLLGGGLVATGPVGAADLAAGSEGELRDAIDAANASVGVADTITIAAGTITLTSALPKITDELTILGAGEGVTILDGDDQFRIFYASGAGALTLENMTIQNGYAGGTGSQRFGGGIRVSTGDLTLSSVTFDGNSARNSGGAVYALGYSIVIDDVTFTNNSTSDSVGYYLSQRGGALRIFQDDGTITISNSTLTGNHAGGRGGAVSIYTTADVSSAITITDSTFADNTVGRGDGTTFPSYGRGGALALYSNGADSITITGSTFNSNASEVGAGALSLFKPASEGELQVDVIDSTFTGNMADSDSYGYSGGGGALVVYGRSATTVTVGSSTFDANSAYWAGAIGTKDADITVDGSTFTGNASVGGAGAVYASSGTLIVTDSEISGNSVSFGPGGGIGAQGATVLIEGSTIENNSAYDAGGGLYVVKYPGRDSLTIRNSTLSGNDSAGRGGAVSTDAALMVEGSTIADNSGTDGGGLYVYASDAVVIETSTVSGNSGDWGGGISARGSGDGSITIRKSTVSGNVADDGGGVRSGLPLVIEQSTITGNSAAGTGGAIYAFKDITIVNSTIAANTAESSQGGVQLYVFDYAAPQALTVTNSIISGNADDGGSGSSDLNVNNESYVDVSIDHSLIGETTIDVSGAGAGNLVDVDPMLGDLSDNGGPTETMRPRRGSPVVDAGDSAAAPFATDQRGATRVLGAAVDVGSVETFARIGAPAGSGASPASVTPGGRFDVKARCRGGETVAFTFRSDKQEATCDGPVSLLATVASVSFDGEASVEFVAPSQPGTYDVEIELLGSEVSYTIPVVVTAAPSTTTPSPTTTPPVGVLPSTGGGERTGLVAALLTALGAALTVAGSRRTRHSD